jgi:hypothetical protein
MIIRGIPPFLLFLKTRKGVVELLIQKIVVK